ncbi:MAG: tRNA 2-thiouridine(34) synthase MnmA [Alphaproteobacteria bacterium]|nr:tRNA 2-thiouridine(34) synthase MnmA [Alphaproteobacteria bacterium]
MRLAVAMSGGVDSSVAAALLKAQGHDVFGITLRLCERVDPFPDSQKVADALGIKLYSLDGRETFSKNVIAPFADSYARGETPLPCALCNQKIKFGLLMDRAKSLGAEALATGHYAQRVETPSGIQLHKGADQTRDQSYFLFQTTRDQLSFLRFPLGSFENKAQTRDLAKKFQLPVSDKPDSQDICFVPNGDYASIVATLRPESVRPGDIVDEQGNVLGRHEGLIHFTIGQRRGINLSNRVGEQNKPLYVLRLDAKSNRVVIGPRSALAQREVFLRDINWIGEDVPETGLAVTVKLRSTQPPQKATFYKNGRLVLAEPTLGAAPGQAGVIYHGSRLLGGGWISSLSPP